MILLKKYFTKLEYEINFFWFIQNLHKNLIIIWNLPKLLLNMKKYDRKLDKKLIIIWNLPKLLLNMKK